MAFMQKSPLHLQIESLPNLVEKLLVNLEPLVRELVAAPPFKKLDRIFITGCGDSLHAALNAQMAFAQIAGIPCESQSSMQFARYTAPFLPTLEIGRFAVLGVSVSGEVSRTIEALDLGRQAGALAVAVTGNRNASLAKVADILLETAVPPLPNQLHGLIVPGARSYYASQLALYLLAVYLGHQRNHITSTIKNELLTELQEIPGLLQETIALCDQSALNAAQSWVGQSSFVFCGSGPNFGTASFSAAKVLEASGDFALAQDLEEWAHLQYFGREVATPTFIISAGIRDGDRAQEIAVAAQAIGRHVAIIALQQALSVDSFQQDFIFPLAGNVREYFSPLLASIPSLLFSSYLSQISAEPYFRGFGGGRSVQGGGGISRIRDSHRVVKLKAF